ncbi:hypothetical protein BUQ74_01630 [Leptospira weilii serovar Heyan]|uniref:hypothetical protein n=1 Tax=Leptospira weilii TaxID=28184 RepID=UPI00077379F1|nr:hypothetical protein [Leptospira weilii]OMI18919.1 hypothetical protein BUQ74_01630 [Leptospira weilii serovar Heyan]
MNKASNNPKGHKKSKVEREMEKLSIQLQQKEIKPMEYAENFPMKVGKHPKAAVIQTALAGFKKKYGVKAYNEIQNDFDVMGVVRHFVVGYMTNLKDAHDALENIKGHKKAFALLVQRAFDESIRVYPWLDDEYYQY